MILARRAAWALCLLAGWWLTLWAAPAIAEEPAKEPAPRASTKAQASTPPAASKTQFVRVTREKNDAVSLDTAIVRYTGRDAQGAEVFVDLVGAIHIGDTSYYEQLNKEFEQYDAVLYELVAPKGARPSRGAAGLWSPLGSMLKLDDQIRVVNYARDNFVHADMSWDQLSASMEKRKESFMGMFMRAIGQGIAQQAAGTAPASDAELLAAMLFARDPSLVWKRVMATQFENMEEATKWLEGPDGSTLIHERNKVALAVLKEQLEQGKRKIAIFYGAGHLPDMERRLVEEFQLKPGPQRWVVAWQLKPPAARRGAGRFPLEAPPVEDSDR
jgi:hypothetical protein